MFEMSDVQLRELLAGYDAVVYAVGPDDRVKPKGDAYTFFHERLVLACGRVVAAARKAGVKRCVVLGSYFAYFDRVWQEQRLAAHHPYIRCRIEQAERVIREGGGKMDVMVLELPYIFGTMPERTPLWKDILVTMLMNSRIVFFPKGGTNMISVRHVGEAVAGAIETGQHGQRYTIGDVNMTWKQMLRMMLEGLGIGNKRIISLPCFLMNSTAKSMKKKEIAEGIQSGLDPLYLFRDIQCRQMWYDPTPSAKALGYGRGGIETAIDETMKACLKDV